MHDIAMPDMASDGGVLVVLQVHPKSAQVQHDNPFDETAADRQYGRCGAHVSMPSIMSQASGLPKVGLQMVEMADT